MNDQGVFKSTTARDPLIRSVNYSAMYCIEKIVDADCVVKVPLICGEHSGLERYAFGFMRERVQGSIWVVLVLGVIDLMPRSLQSHYHRLYGDEYDAAATSFHLKPLPNHSA